MFPFPCTLGSLPDIFFSLGLSEARSSRLGVSPLVGRVDLLGLLSVSTERGSGQVSVYDFQFDSQWHSCSRSHFRCAILINTLDLTSLPSR